MSKQSAKKLSAEIKAEITAMRQPTTHDDKAREREQFEVWALSEGDFSRTQLSLNTPMAQVAWDAWISRAALSPASSAGQEMPKVPQCCTQDCNQGRNCPLRHQGSQ